MNSGKGRYVKFLKEINIRNQVKSKMINLKDYINQKELISLLSECIYPNEERVLQEYEQYRNDKSRKFNKEN